LPRSLELAEQQLKIRPEIARFVLTIGSTANQNGTALFEGITVLFLAQVYGVDLSLGQQVQVVMMSILAGIGTAGVPGGSLPLIMILTQQVGIPAEGMGLILGVDRFLDMCRTTLNVSGDLVIAALVNEQISSVQVKAEQNGFTDENPEDLLANFKQEAKHDELL
jgi:DAACS family dicarboxylate/amino acid:cation (Na+ or H+) symporter